MRVSITVRAVAEAIAGSQLSLSPTQQARVEVLRAMPVYKGLKVWEEAYGQPPSLEPDTALDILLDAVFDFGQYNLYCRFDPEGTKRVYNGLCNQLRSAGVDCPATDDFTGF